MKKNYYGFIVAFMCVVTPYMYRAAGDQLGKTHFIVGYDHKKSARVERKKIKTEDGARSFDEQSATQAFFTSRHDVRSIISSLLNTAQKTLLVAAFTVTDKGIVECLKKAHKRGVNVQVVTDQGTMRERSSKIKMLMNASIPVFSYNHLLNPNPKQKEVRYTPLMHHKFIVIDDKAVITGSSNLTHAGQVRNMENIVVIRDKSTVTEYAKEFTHLKTTCVTCSAE